MKAAPIVAGEKQLSIYESFSGLVVNSGNANACTGKKGIEDYYTITKHFEEKLELEEGSLLMSSTGVIGVHLPVTKFLSNSDLLINSIDDEDEGFATAIMTTDTRPKKIAVLVESNKGAYVIGGVAKEQG